MKASNIKDFLVNLAVLSVTLLVCFILGEVVVRFAFSDSVVLFPRYHTDAVYGEYTLRKNRPDSKFKHRSVDGIWEFETNAQGFRNTTDFTYEKPEGMIRVVSIGDSHTMGYEVNQGYTFSAIIQKGLEHRGVSNQVLNSGVAGFSNAEELLLLDNELSKFGPDFVVLGFFANDYQDNLKAGLFELDSEFKLRRTLKREHIPGVRIQNFIYAIPGVKYLSENSYFYSLLFNLVWNRAKELLTEQSVENAMEVAIPTKKNFDEYEKQMASELIKEIYSVCQKLGAKLVILDIPTYAENGDMATSLDEQMRNLIAGSYDLLVPAETLEKYDGLSVIHVPHGHRHISEFTHVKFGMDVVEFIFEQND